MRIFLTFLCKGYVYALGGRKYGVDNKAVITDCERMDIETRKWERIASLNYPRCTSMIYAYKGKIYLAGGFYITGKRIRSIEIYDPEVNIWYMSGKSR